MDTNSIIGLAILGGAVLLGFVFLRKFLSIILILAVLGVSIWFFFMR